MFLGFLGACPNTVIAMFHPSGDMCFIVFLYLPRILFAWSLRRSDSCCNRRPGQPLPDLEGLEGSAGHALESIPKLTVDENVGKCWQAKYIFPKLFTKNRR